MGGDSLKARMQYQDQETVLSSLVRVGYVTDVDNRKRVARVKFDDLGITSDWLPVLINRDFVPDYDTPQKTEERGGGTLEAAYEAHDHELTIKPYMPKVNEQVLTLYLPVRNGQGFILGGIQPWQ